MRLSNKVMGATAGSELGILEIFHAGAWGTICNGSSGIPEVCQQPGGVGMAATCVVTHVSGAVLYTHAWHAK